MPFYVDDIIEFGDALRGSLDELYDIRDRTGSKDELERSCIMLPATITHKKNYCSVYGFQGHPFLNRCYIYKNRNNNGEYIEEYTIVYVDKDKLITNSISETADTVQEAAQMIFDFLADNIKPIQD